MLIYIGLFEEMFDEMDSIYPGCLVASYIYELQQFDEEIQGVVSETFLMWRSILKEWFDEIIEKYPPKIEVDTTYLADMFTSTIEGAFIMAKGLNDIKETPQQLRQYKNYIELLFTP